MLKYQFTFAILLIACLNAFSQKEIVSGEMNTDEPKEESLKGFEIRLIPYSNGLFFSQIGNSMIKPFSMSTYVGYLNEKRIVSSWTLLLTAGLHNVLDQRPVYRPAADHKYGYFVSVSPNEKITYSLVLEAGIEPRLYWGSKKHYQAGNTHLNTGWFLSFPLLFQTTILHTPEPFIGMGWFPSVLYSGSFLLTPTVGYRQAISEKWFLEGSIGYGANVIVAANSVDNTFTVLNPEFNPVFKLKAAYTLK
jgi:hypothetical protein